MSSQSINISITENGARRVSEGIAGIGEAASGSEHLLSLLKETLGVLGLAATIHELIETADEFTNLQNKIRLVTDGQEQLAVVTDRLLEVANHTRSEFESVVQVYSRVARSAKQLGISQNEAINFVQTLSEAITLSGVSSREASVGLLELAHGFSQGKLQSREFRVIMKDVPEVANAMATAVGTTTAHLFKMAEQGKLTGKFIVDAMTRAAASVEEKFGKTVPTVSQALTVLSNTWEVFLGKINAGAGITAALAQGIIYVAQHMDEFVRVAAALAVTLGATLALRAIPALISALFTMNATLLANPILLVVSLLAAFSDQIYVDANSLIQLRDVGTVVWNELVKGVRWLRDQFVTAFNYISDKVFDTFQTMSEDSMTFPEMVAKGLDNIVGVFLATMTGLVHAAKQAWTNISDGFSHMWDFIKSGFDPAVLAKHGALLGTSFGEAFRDGFVRGFDNSPTFAQDMLKGLMARAGDAAEIRRQKEAAEKAARDKALKQLDIKGPPGPVEPDKFKKSFGSELEELRKKGILLLQTTQTRKAQNDVMQIEEHLKRNLTETELQQVVAVARTNAALEARSEALHTLGDPLEEFVRKSNALNAVMRDTPELTQQVTEELSKLELQLLQSQQGGTFLDGYVRQLRIMQLETRNAVSQIGSSFATIFGPGGTIVQGIGDAIAQSIVFGQRFDQAIKHLAQSVISSLISSLVQLGINMVLNAALGNTLAVAAAATSAATATAVAAAWGPAATLVNAATFGAGAAAGTGALAASLATVKGLAAVSGFSAGGYTGGSPLGSVAGVVHGQEYVLNAAATKRLGVQNLDRMNKGMSWNQPTMNVTVHNSEVPNVAFEVNQVSHSDVEIIARRVVATEAPNVIAQDISNPSSRTSRSLTTHTTATRKRA